MAEQIYLININTGEVWELKTRKTGAAAADDQVKKYCNANLDTKGGPKIRKGNSRVFCDYFYLECVDSLYLVNYWTPQDGVILYDIQKTDTSQVNPFAVYIPKRQESKDRASVIGGIPAYGLPSAPGYGYSNEGSVWLDVLAVFVFLGSLCSGIPVIA